MNYQVIHRCSGRIRLRISRLRQDEDYGNLLKGLLEMCELITEVRIAGLAQSLIIYYHPKAVGAKFIEQKVIEAIFQVNSWLEKPKLLPAQNHTNPAEVNLESNQRTNAIAENSIPESPTTTPADGTSRIGNA
jgi:hypothetical protein